MSEKRKESGSGTERFVNGDTIKSSLGSLLPQLGRLLPSQLDDCLVEVDEKSVGRNRVIYELFRSVVRHVDDILKYFRKTLEEKRFRFGNDGDKKCSHVENLLHDATRREDLVKLLESCEVLLDGSWEFGINCGHWTEVPRGWRLVYGFTSLFKVFLLFFLEDDRTRLLEVIRVCDMG